jgi:hypothetical protein
MSGIQHKQYQAHRTRGELPGAAVFGQPGVHIPGPFFS